jgi:hypothetical protein
MTRTHLPAIALDRREFIKLGAVWQVQGSPH